MKITGNKNRYTHQIPEFQVKGIVVKADHRYIVEDNTTLKNLVLSSTRLKAKKETSGHNHKGQEEVYFFIEGYGEMQLDDDKFSVEPGSIVLIKEGVFHKVYNTGDNELYFVCVLHGARHK